ncbi:MAG: flavodoxin-dependent (E)-4-hydroxy-3-methylbut-2-enyl-diphosphate synthase, partial [Planctomycetia bacterium]|nr:flavodoxin-dependent (E)-4-hydroxy-3-methylbut-2-enyl-diphosphate synthase [Planctomycetia bacterium]
MILRRKTRTVMVGSVAIGGDAPVTVQSMTKTNTCDIAATVKQANNLAEAGCELVRIAVPTLAAARAIAEIQPAVNVPVIADVHFRPEIAIAALESGADKIRLNPGNTR